MSRDIKLFFIGFLSCILVTVIGFKIVLVRESLSIQSAELVQSEYLTNVGRYNSNPERQEVLELGALPSDILETQHLTPKFHMTDASLYAFVYGDESTDGDMSFLGALRLNKEKKRWEKFVEVKGDYSIRDLWYEEGATLENPHLLLTVVGSAYRHDGIVIDLKQTEAGKNKWSVVRCYFGTNEAGTDKLGIDREFAKNSRGEWFLYSSEVKQEIIDLCNNPPPIILHT